MKNYLSRCTVAAMVCLVLFSIVAISGYSATQQQVIKYVRWSSASQEEANFRKIIDAFMQKNPTIKVEATFGSWNSYFDKLSLAIASSTTPDVVSMSNSVGSAYYRDVFADLTPYIKKDKIDTKKLVPNLMDAFTLNKKVYCMPTDLAIWGMMYNKDIFDAAGIPYPSATKPMTWDQFLDLAQKFTKAGQVGYNDQNNLGARQYFMTTAYGGNLFNSQINPTKITIGSPEGRKALEMLTKLAKVMPPVAEWGKQWEGGLMNKKAAMATNGPWGYADCVNAGIKFGVAPLPEGVPGARIIGNVNALMMSNTSKNKDAAWKLIKFFMGEDAQALVARNGIGVPILPGMANFQQLMEEYAKTDMSAYSYMIKYYMPQWIMPNSTVKTFIIDQIRNLDQGTLTVDEFVNKVTKDGQKMLDELYTPNWSS